MSRYISKIVGILVLTAYLMLIGSATDSKPVVFLVDVLSGLSVIGVAILMYPLFKIFGKLASVGYFITKLIEGSLMLLAGSFFLIDSMQYLRTEIYGGVQTWSFILSSFFFYYLLYISKLVPRFISIWGVIAICCLLIITVLKLFSIDISTIEFLLILVITNELFLAVWLLTKGLNKTSKV